MINDIKSNKYIGRYLNNKNHLLIIEDDSWRVVK